MKLRTKVSVIAVTFTALSITFAWQQSLLNYELVDWAKNSSPYMSYDEITAELNEIEKDKLKKLSCSSFDLKSLWTDYLTTNPMQDSLRVRGSNGIDYIYKEGEIYTQDGQWFNPRRDVFVSKFIKAVSKLNSYPSGKKIVDLLQISPHKIIIASGANRLVSDNQNNSGAIQIIKTGYKRVSNLVLNQIGSSGVLRVNLETPVNSLEQDFVYRANPWFVVLGHELYHAYDMVRGLIDRRYVISNEIESAELAEYRAVFFENTIRREAGLKFRLTYGDKKENFKDSIDLLDKNNQPIWLPTVCL